MDDDILKNKVEPALARIAAARSFRNLSLRKAPTVDTTDWDLFLEDLFIADWACYLTPADRVDFPRLARVVKTFPAGFNLWMADVDGVTLPVGYTGWHPMTPDSFALLYNEPESVKDRGFAMPLTAEEAEGSYLYLFNYSLIPQLRGRTEMGSAILRQYAADVNAVRKKGMTAITVSEEGARVAKRFGLSYRGSMMFAGEKEDIYALRA